MRVQHICRANTQHGRSKLRGVASIVTLCCHTSVSYMAYLIRRGAFYYLNLRLPKHLFPRCHTLRLSLKRTTRQAATFVAASLAQQVHQHLAEHPTEALETLRKLCKVKETLAKHPTMSADDIAKVAGCGVATVYRIKREMA